MCDGYIVAKIAKSLLFELEGRFTSHEVLDVFGIIYP